MHERTNVMPRFALRAGLRVAAVAAVAALLVPATRPIAAVTLRPLSAGGGEEGTAAVAWSPDGRTIAAHHWYIAPPNSDIASFVFAFDVASGEPVTIRGLEALPHGTTPGLVMHPTWSPDGTRLGVSSDFQLWTVSVAESSAAQVSAVEARGPSWSPDGSRFVYAGTGGLWIVHAAGGASARLTTGFDADAVWSHDGTRIAFARMGDLMIVPATGGTPVPLTTGPEDDAEPTWSPDGSLVAFSALRGGRNDIWVVRTATGQLSQLTDDDAIDFSPDWSPDGSSIAFVSNRDGTQRIWIATDLSTSLVTTASWSGVKGLYR